MAHVLEFESARVQLHVVLLRELGVPDILAWRLLGTPRDRLWDGTLYAAPLLVATRRDGAVSILDLKPGPTPSDITDAEALMAALDAAVVRQHLERLRSPCAQILNWIVYSDGGRIEINTPPDQVAQLRQQAQRTIRDHEWSEISTHALVARWCGRNESHAHDS